MPPWLQKAEQTQSSQAQGSSLFSEQPNDSDDQLKACVSSNLKPSRFHCWTSAGFTRSKGQLANADSVASSRQTPANPLPESRLNAVTSSLTFTQAHALGLATPDSRLSPANVTIRLGEKADDGAGNTGLVLVKARLVFAVQHLAVVMSQDDEVFDRGAPGVVGFDQVTAGGAFADTRHLFQRPVAGHEVGAESFLVAFSTGPTLPAGAGCVGRA